MCPGFTDFVKKKDLNVSIQKKIKKLVNNNTGVSQRKIANTLKISQSAVRNIIKKMGLRYKKLTRAPKKKQREIDQDIVIKMFDHLKGRVHMANQNGLQSL